MENRDMTRSELSEFLSKRFPMQISQDAETSVRVILQAITEALAKDHRLPAM